MTSKPDARSLRVVQHAPPERSNYTEYKREPDSDQNNVSLTSKRICCTISSAHQSLEGPCFKPQQLPATVGPLSEVSKAFNPRWFRLKGAFVSDALMWRRVVVLNAFMSLSVFVLVSLLEQ